jgi:hypothetical protein
VECIAVAADDIVRLCHFFLEAGIVRREQVATLRSFDQEQRLTVPGVQTMDDLFRQDNSERVPEFADLEFDHVCEIRVRRLVRPLGHYQRLVCRICPR